MKKISILYLFVILLLTACNNTQSILTEVNENELNNSVAKFVDKVKNNDGIYLFSRLGEDEYLILNYMHVVEGEKAQFLNTINTEIISGELIVSLEVNDSDNYQDKRVGKLRIFKLNKIEKYDSIQILKNNIETSIDLVGG